MLAELVIVGIAGVLVGAITAVLGYYLMAGRMQDNRPISSALEELKIPEKLGSIQSAAEEMRTEARNLRDLFTISKERASLGEMGLEAILADQLPKGTYGIRKDLGNGKMPDAHIRMADGKVLCIDSKFPLDNYRKAVEAREQEEQERAEKAFLKDIEGHLQKIAEDYVQGKDSPGFALAFIPSEAVYYFLVTKGHGLAMRFSQQGVYPVSPLTLGMTARTIAAGHRADELSRNAERVKEQLEELAGKFNEVDNSWKTLNQHIRNTGNKAEEVDSGYRRIRESFDRIGKGE